MTGGSTLRNEGKENDRKYRRMNWRYGNYTTFWRYNITYQHACGAAGLVTSLASGMSAKLSAALRLNNALIERLIPNVGLGRIEFFVGEVERTLRRG